MATRGEAASWWKWSLLASQSKLSLASPLMLHLQQGLPFWRHAAFDNLNSAEMGREESFLPCPLLGPRGRYPKTAASSPFSKARLPPLRQALVSRMDIFLVKCVKSHSYFTKSQFFSFTTLLVLLQSQIGMTYRDGAVGVCESIRPGL